MIRSKLEDHGLLRSKTLTNPAAEYIEKEPGHDFDLEPDFKFMTTKETWQRQEDVEK